MFELIILFFVVLLFKIAFYQKVKFSNNSERYDINEDLEEAVDRILRANNALTK